MSAADFESVIGLEVHVQLATRSKLFSGSATEYGAPPNTHIDPVCTGQPGVLPVLNEEALRLGIRAGLALGCTVPERTKFDRKNYFYPDLPKGYQISQFDRPLNVDGGVEIEGDDGATRRIAIVRAHLEEDAGKTVHPPGADHSLVDLNRAGIPLLEIVSAPEIRSPEEAFRYLSELKRILRYARVSDCDMEKGSLRCDANVSVRRRGETRLGTRTEIKNLNSFRNVERALAHEIARQIAVIESGGEVVQETRLWREAEERTETMRSKEEAQDYRYFPDPDLPELVIPRERVEEIRAELPELPGAKRARYESELGLPAATAAVLAGEWEIASYFERCLAVTGASAAGVANYVLSAALQEANEKGVPVTGIALAPEALADVVERVERGEISHQAAKKVLAEVSASGRAPEEVIAALGLKQVSDEGELLAVVREVVAENEKAVREFREGKAAALNALVGAVMKKTKGKANPNLSRELLSKELGGPPA